MNRDHDMTIGNPYLLIGKFAFAMVLGNIFQQLYVFVDAFIVGNSIGQLGLVAIGNTDWPVFLVNGFIIGIIQGFSVLLGGKYGQKDYMGFRAYYKKSGIICFILCVFLTPLCFFMSGPVLRAVAVKPEVYPFALTYIRTLSAGLPFLIFYQFFAGILRSRGNSSVPLMALTISSVCNIILDIVFIYVFELGIFGAALGTIISEGIVMLVCGFYILKMKDPLAEKHDISLVYESNGEIVLKLLKMGIPMSLQSVITSVGGMIVMNRINQFDLPFLTGYTVAGKIYALLEICASSFGLAIAAYVSQNYGIENHLRIRKGVRAGLLMGIVCSAVCSIIMIVWGRIIMMLFLRSESDLPLIEESLNYGDRYLHILSVFFFLLFVLYIMRSTLQGINNSVIPTISSFGQLLMRLFFAAFLTRSIGSDAIFWGEIAAWIAADIVLWVTYGIYVKSLKTRFPIKKCVDSQMP